MKCLEMCLVQIISPNCTHYSTWLTTCRYCTTANPPPPITLHRPQPLENRTDELMYRVMFTALSFLLCVYIFVLMSESQLFASSGNLHHSPSLPDQSRVRVRERQHLQYRCVECSQRSLYSLTAFRLCHTFFEGVLHQKSNEVR